jgi:hydrogenase maturation protease
VLVLGVGNILLRDEGVGVRVVEALQRTELPPQVELFDGGTIGADLLDVIADRRKVIVIDAVLGDFEPGTVLRMTPADLAPHDRPSASLHDFGVLETLTLARRMNAEPDEVVLIGVKPFRVEYGLELTPEMQRLVPRLVDAVLEELHRT